MRQFMDNLDRTRYLLQTLVELETLPPLAIEERRRVAREGLRRIGAEVPKVAMEREQVSAPKDGEVQ